jgi:cytochrome P450
MVKGAIPKMFIGSRLASALSLIFPLISEGEKAATFVKEYAMKIVEDRRSGKTRRREDLLQRLVDAEDPESHEKLSDKEVANNTMWVLLESLWIWCCSRLAVALVT